MPALAVEGEAAFGGKALVALDAREEARRITAPMLILCGSEEGQPFKNAATWMQENIRGSQVAVVPVAGHASVRERPEFVIGKPREVLG